MATFEDLINGMLKQINKTRKDVKEVWIDDSGVKYKLIIDFTDGTEAMLECDLVHAERH